MSKHSKKFNRITAIILCLLFLFSYSNCYAAEKAETVISGVSKSISAFSNKELKKTIIITPANGKRTVLLQLYSSKDKKYKTVKTYISADANTAEITILFPKSKRKKTSGKWRIYVKQSSIAKSAEKISNLTSKNIVSKDISCKAACIYCIDDNKDIYEKKVHKELKQASLTKLMTATLLIESNKLDGSTKISEKAAKTPYSHPKMVKGDSYTNKALLHAMLLPSSNGASVAVAESVSGSTKEFVKEMNAKAKWLGMQNTHYVNTHGLDANNHYSSAYDTALLMSNIYSKSKTFRTIIAKDKYKIKSKKGRSETLYSTDMLKGYSTKHKGGKSGTTTGAGYCFCGVYVHKNKTYVVCILGSKSDDNRWKDMKSLYKYINEYAATKY
ncbi:MAG: D-alanyl-D-alanine carboxypeptidase [Ruminococcaceae bacterium]|nr:D-alanyl-D-alanine carboxypeptidase [Oscillospiraceae bacterium]